MQSINFNVNNTKIFIDWLQAGAKKHAKDKVAKVAEVIPNSIPPAPIAFPPIPVMEIPAPVIEVSVPIIETPTPIVSPSS